MNDHLKPFRITEDAILHLDAALKSLCLEAYREDDAANMRPVEHFTIAEDLKRIDGAIGPKGKSIFAKIADSIQEAYVEILAAREALAKAPPPQAHLASRAGPPGRDRPLGSDREPAPQVSQEVVLPASYLEVHEAHTGPLSRALHGLSKTSGSHGVGASECISNSRMISGDGHAPPDRYSEGGTDA